MDKKAWNSPQIDELNLNKTEATRAYDYLMRPGKPGGQPGNQPGGKPGGKPGNGPGFSNCGES